MRNGDGEGNAQLRGALAWLRARFLPVAGIALSLAGGYVQATDYRTEYDKRIKSSQNIGVLGKDVAGDQLNFYTGSTTFAAQDLSIPGNSALPFSVGRTYTVEYEHMVADAAGTQANPVVQTTRQYAFGDWDLDIPYMTGRFDQGSGWQVDSTTPLNRCSVVGAMKGDGSAANGTPKKPTSRPPTGYYGGEPWNGYTLHVDSTDQPLLLASLPNNARPSAGGPYHWLTEKHWWVSCLAPTSQSGNGEGFLAHAPDGSRYWFDKLSKRNVSHLWQQIFDGIHYKHGYTFAADIFLLPTRIEDRFGNWVTFAYSNDTYARLLGISSHDGRQLILTYNAQGLVDTLSDGSRTVRYEYIGSSLSRVVLPDGSAWQYELSGLSNSLPHYQNSPVTALAHVVSPSGARVDFEFSYHFQANRVPCAVIEGEICTTTLGMTKKRISGAGLPSQEWQYAYGVGYEAFMNACGTYLQSCPTRTWTDEISPDYAITRRMYGIVKDQDETLLLQELQGVVPTTTNTYTVPTGGNITASARIGDLDLVDDPLSSGVSTTTVTGPPQFFHETNYYYPTLAQAPRLGVNPLDFIPSPDSRPQITVSERHLSPIRRTVSHLNRMFTWRIDEDCAGLCVDDYGRPTKVTKSSAPAQ